MTKKMFFIFSNLEIRGNFTNRIKKLQENTQLTSQEIARGPGRRQGVHCPHFQVTGAGGPSQSLGASSKIVHAGNPKESAKGPQAWPQGGREGPCIEGGLAGWGGGPGMLNVEEGLPGPSAQEAAQDAELFEGKLGQACSVSEIGRQILGGTAWLAGLGCLDPVQGANSQRLRVCIGGVGGWGLAVCERPQLRPLFIPKL